MLLIFSLAFAMLSMKAAGGQSPTVANEEVFICFEGKVHAEQAELGGQFYEQMSELVKTQPGFISQTPFESIDQDFGQVLYVRFDNEQHLHAWKNNHVHLGIQAKGRADVFVDYRLRIRNEAFPGRSHSPDNHTASAGKYLLLWQYPTALNDTTDESSSCTSRMAPSVDSFAWQQLVDAATYVNDVATLRISSWPTKEIGLIVKAGVPRVAGDDLRLVRVERDYGRFQRQEAPGDADRCQAAAAANDTEGLERC